MQSGKPVGVFRTHADAPRVLIANSNLVPHWATWEHFNELDRKGLMMYGQMTAGSWIYIGTQGIVQGTYETFVEMGRRHYGGDLAGQWILTAGLGGMGGAQPLAAMMAGASLPGRRVPARAASSSACAPAISTRRPTTSTRRWRSIERSCRRDEAASRWRCSATRPRSFPSWSAAACGPTSSPTRPPRTTRSTATCRRAGPLGEWEARRESDPEGGRAGRPRSMARARRAPCSISTARACRRSTTATTSARWRWRKASPTPSPSRASCRPISARCSAAASGRSAGRRCRAIPEDIYRTDAKVKELLPDNAHLHHWLDMARERIPSRACRRASAGSGLGDRHRLGLAFNEMVARGRAEGARS